MDWIDKHEWEDNIASPLSEADVSKFQECLDEIVGVEPSGAKRWRLVWGMDGDVSVEWDRYGHRWVPRYRWKAVEDKVLNPSTGIFENRTSWIGVPRYFIEALIPRPHQAKEAESAGVDADGQVYTERRVTGADYVTMLAICQHDERWDANGWRPCCLRRTHEKKTCYGRYRVPDRIDLDTLAADYRRRVESKLCRPDEQLAARDREFLYSAWMLDQLREEQKVNEELAYRRRLLLQDVLPMRLNGFPGAKKNRFSIPGM